VALVHVSSDGLFRKSATKTFGKVCRDALQDFRLCAGDGSGSIVSDYLRDIVEACRSYRIPRLSTHEVALENAIFCEFSHVMAHCRLRHPELEREVTHEGTAIVARENHAHKAHSRGVG
jgi:hypothetical protein